MIETKINLEITTYNTINTPADALALFYSVLNHIKQKNTFSGVIDTKSRIRAKYETTKTTAHKIYTNPKDLINTAFYNIQPAQQDKPTPAEG